MPQISSLTLNHELGFKLLLINITLINTMMDTKQMKYVKIMMK